MMFLKICPKINTNYASFGNSIQNPIKSHEKKEIPLDTTNPNIIKACHELDNVEFSQDDIDYVKQMGIVLPFTRGKDAIAFMKANNIKVGFAPIESKQIYAQYDNEKNIIKVNSLYKDSSSLADITAISGAILHELGHAKDKDSQSSIQEEMENLPINALSFRAFKKEYGQLSKDSPISDVAQKYSKLFFDENPKKSALIARLADKYGNLSDRKSTRLNSSH